MTHDPKDVINTWRNTKKKQGKDYLLKNGCYCPLAILGSELLGISDDELMTDEPEIGAYIVKKAGLTLVGAQLIMQLYRIRSWSLARIADFIEKDLWSFFQDWEKDKDLR